MINIVHFSIYLFIYISMYTFYLKNVFRTHHVPCRKWKIFYILLCDSLKISAHNATNKTAPIFAFTVLRLFIIYFISATNEFFFLINHIKEAYVCSKLCAQKRGPYIFNWRLDLAKHTRQRQRTVQRKHNSIFFYRIFQNSETTLWHKEIRVCVCVCEDNLRTHNGFTVLNTLHIYVRGCYAHRALRRKGDAVLFIYVWKGEEWL